MLEFGSLVEYGPSPGELTRRHKLKVAAMARMKASLARAEHGAKPVVAKDDPERETFMTEMGPAYQVEGMCQHSAGGYLHPTTITLRHVGMRVFKD